MALTESEFRSRCDQAFETLNRALDVVADQYDVEILFQNNVLSIEVEDPNPGKIVISPQAPTRQVWISAQSTSFKLDWSDGEQDFVLAKTGEKLKPDDAFCFVQERQTICASHLARKSG